MRDNLHPILKTMGRGSAGFHIFRRFRESVLQMSEVRTLLIDYWMGHANGEMAGRYGKQLLDNVRWRQDVQPRLDLVSCYQQTEASRCWTSLDKFLKWKSQKQLRSKSI